MSLPDQLPHRCDISRSVTVEDGEGGDYDAPETVESGRACWVQPASDSEINVFQRREQRVSHKVYFRGNPGIAPGYILTPADGIAACPFAGATLEVKSVNEATVGTGILWRAMCEELQPR